MKTPAALNQLLQKPMNRKEFLQHTAAITLFVAGGGMLAQSLVKGMNLGGGASTSSVSSGAASGFGYGGSIYGGSKLAARK